MLARYMLREYRSSTGNLIGNFIAARMRTRRGPEDPRLGRYQCWQVYRPGAAQASKSRGYHILANFVDGSLITPKRRRRDGHVGSLAQLAPTLAGSSLRGGAGVEEAWASRLYDCRSWQVPHLRGGVIIKDAWVS